MVASLTANDAIQVQERDLALLLGLFESRIMTREHIVTLYFEGKAEYAKKRLQKIIAAGFIGERRRGVTEKAVLFLTKKGFNLVKNEGLLSSYPPLSANSFEARANVSDSTLRHELEIMDVKAAFHASLSKSEKFSLLEFSTWPLLYEFEAPSPGFGRDRLMKPDGFIRIHEKEEGTKGFVHECFLEVDRSSEHQEVLVTKGVCYAEYYKSGGFAVRNGASRSAFKDFPFRILMILKSAVRRNNTAERLAQNNPPILTQVWLTTIAEATSNPLGAIWMLPVDYRKATAGTPHYAEQPNRRFEYQHRPEREAFVEEKISKRCLLTGETLTFGTDSVKTEPKNS